MKKETRNIVYTMLLNYYQAGGSPIGLCRGLRHCYNQAGGKGYVSVMRFPEIMKHQPEKLDGIYWFSFSKTGMQKRIEILKQSIKETEI